MNQHIYHQTPIFQSHELLASTGQQVFYKMDCYQPSGSFKIRGMEALCLHMKQEGYTKLLASSGGNAGYSLAYVGKELGMEIKVIVPQTTPQFMIYKIRKLGATIEVFGKDWDETHQYASKLSEEENIPYVPPFDHPLLWKGHATMIDECANSMDEPDQIVVAVGGGGLLLGVMEGLYKNNWKKVKLIAAETQGAASFAASQKAGKLVSLEKIETIATSLGAKKVAAELFERAKNFEISSHVVDDAVAIAACENLMNEYNVLVEPACGAALSYGMNHIFSGTTLIIVCGGVNMSLSNFESYKKQYL